MGIPHNSFDEYMHVTPLEAKRSGLGTMHLTVIFFWREIEKNLIISVGKTTNPIRIFHVHYTSSTVNLLNLLS